MNETIKKGIARSLLGFVLISIGFAVGKEYGKRLAPAPVLPGPPADVSQTGTTRVLVYYMHSTIRCVTCNQIESMAKRFVDREYAAALQDGRVVWQEVNYQEQEDLAKRFNVVASTVVVVKLRGEEVLAFRNLDQVWALYPEPAKFDAYLGEAIAALLKEDRQ